MDLDFEEILSSIRRSVLKFTNDQNKTVPKNYASEYLFEEIDRFKNLVANKCEKYYSEFETRLMLCLNEHETSSLFEKNYIEVVIQIMVEITKYINSIYDENFFKTFNHSLNVLTIAYDPVLPTMCLQSICNLISVTSKSASNMAEIIHSNILRDLNNFFNPQFWGALIIDLESLAAAFLFLAKNASKFSDQILTQFIYELEYSIFRLSETETSIFHKDIEVARNLFQAVDNWSNKNTLLAQVILTILLPEKINRGNYATVYKTIRENIDKKNNLSLQLRFIQPLCKVISLSKGQNKVMVDVFNKTTHKLVDNILDILQKITPESLLYVLLALFYSDSPKFDVLINIVKNDVTNLPIIAQFVDNTRDSHSPIVYDLVKLCLQSDQQEIYVFFDNDPAFFSNFMIADPSHVDLILKKLLEIHSQDLIYALVKFFHCCPDTVKINRAGDYVRMLNQLYSKSLLCDEQQTHRIPNAMEAIAEYAAKVAEKDKNWAALPKIITCLEPSIYLALTSRYESEQACGFRIISRITQISKIIKQSIEPAYIEITEVLKTSKFNINFTNLQLMIPMNKISTINPQVVKVLTNIFYTLTKYNQAILTAEDDPDQTELKPFQASWANCLFTCSILDTMLSNQVIDVLIEVLKLGTFVPKKIASNLAYVIHPKHLAAIVQRTIDSCAPLDLGNPTNINLTYNILTIFRNLYDHPKTKQLDLSLVEAFIVRSVKVGHVTRNMPLLFVLCQVTQRINLNLFDASFRLSFIQSVTFWISQIMITENKSNVDALITILVTTLIKLVDDVVLKREMLRSLLSSLVILIRKRAETAILVKDCFMNLYKKNARALIEDMYIFCFGGHVAARETFADALITCYERLNLDIPDDSILDNFLTGSFIEEFSDICPQALLESAAMLFTQASIVRKCSKQYMERMVKLELKNANESNKNMILRGNGISSRSITNFAKYYGNDWVFKMFDTPIKRFTERITNGENFEINPQKGEINPANFLSFLEDITNSVDTLFEHPPEEIVFLMKLICDSVSALFDNEFGFTISHGFLFLRLILPMLSIPDSFGVTEQTHKDVILNISVVVMAAINKGDMLEKKQFYHFFNDFAGKTRTKYVETMRKFLDQKSSFGEYDKQILSIGMIESRTISHLAPTLPLIGDLLKKIDTEEKIHRAFKEYNKHHNGHPSTMNVNAISMSSPNVSDVVKQAVPAPIAQMMANTVFRVSPNLVVFQAIKLPAVQFPQAFQKEMIALASEQKEELSVIMDFTGYSDKDFNIGPNVLVLMEALPQIMDCVKEVIVLNGSEYIYDKLDATPIRKKMISAEKMPDFDMKYSETLKSIIHERINSALMSIPFQHKGKEHICNLMKNSIIVSHAYGSRIACDYFPFEEIDTFKMEASGFSFASNGTEYTINCADSNFAAVTQLSIINMNRTKQIYMNLSNVGTLIHIARLVKDSSRMAQINEADSQALLDELVNLLAFGHKDVMKKLLINVEPYLDMKDKMVNTMYTFIKARMQ